MFRVLGQSNCSFGIRSISYARAPLVSMTEKALGFGKSEEFLIRRIGTRNLPRLAGEDSVTSLAVSAVRNLVRETPSLDLSLVDCLVVVTQNGEFQGLPHTSALLQESLGLREEVMCFDIGLGCSGYSYALRIIEGLHAMGECRDAILVTADHYSRIIDSSDPSTELLFGDAATATWMGAGSHWRTLATAFTTSGAGFSAIYRDKSLHMNGKEVLSFARRDVPRQIRSALEKSGILVQDVDLFLVHQGSQAVVEGVAREFPGLEERFPILLEDFGNTVSSTIPILVKSHMLQSRQKCVVLAGFGVGLSIGVAVMGNVGLTEESSHACL